MLGNEISFSMIRSFMPVGHGAFCCEDFRLGDKELHVVYDCGSALGESFINKQIKTEFSKDEKIDALFISHFDNDYINGISFLLKNYDVRNIFFPYLTEEESLYFYLSDLINNNDKISFAGRCIENIEKFLTEKSKNKDINLYAIMPHDCSKKNVKNCGLVGNCKNSRIAKLPSGDVTNILKNTSPVVTSLLWKFEVYNYKYSTIKKFINNQLKQLFGKEPDIETVKERYVNIKNEISTLLSKDSYTSSMVLFSFQNNEINTEITDVKINVYNRIPKGCVYVENFDVMHDDFSSVDNKIKAYIECVHISCKGAIDDNFDWIFDGKKNAVIYMKRENQYRAPGLCLSLKWAFRNPEIKIFRLTDYNESRCCFNFSNSSSWKICGSLGFCCCKKNLLMELKCIRQDKIKNQYSSCCILCQ